VFRKKILPFVAKLLEKLTNFNEHFSQYGGENADSIRLKAINLLVYLLNILC